MTESLNNTYFILIAVLVYLFLVLFSLVNTAAYVFELYKKIGNNIRSVLNRNEKLKSTADTFRVKISQPVRSGFLSFLNFLRMISQYLLGFDETLKKKTLYTFDEPVNYTALAFRKLYELNFQAWIVISAASIVVFYFILTVF